MISLKDGKKILFENINDWFNNQGYYYSKRTRNFIKETDNWKYSMHFNFHNKSTNHFNSTIYMHSKVVEEIILTIGMPDMILETYKSGEDILNTIHDKVNLDSFMKKMAKINLETSAGYIEWAELIKQYMDKDAFDFLSQYSYLPNVLKEIENIEKRGQEGYRTILAGRIEHLFRALIISKLCNDENYQERKLRIDKLILQPNYPSWHPYYKKLIDFLDNYDPDKFIFS